MHTFYVECNKIDDSNLNLALMVLKDPVVLKEFP